MATIYHAGKDGVAELSREPIDAREICQQPDYFFTAEEAQAYLDEQKSSKRSRPKKSGSDEPEVTE